MAVFRNKVAIVTGGASGIGLAIVEKFLAQGAKVVIADKDEEAGNTVVKDLDSDSLEFVVCDVANKLDINNLVITAIDKYKVIDILVNNAAIVHAAGFLELTEEDFQSVLDINLKGYFLMGQAVARQMIKQIEEGKPEGCIVNLSSINALVSVENQPAYCISKGAVLQLTRSMALDLSRYGIRVNAVGPGSVMTKMMRKVNSSAEKRRDILLRTPLRRIAEPHEVASVVSFLASAEASYITGETIYVDGGRLGLNYMVDVDE